MDKVIMYSKIIVLLHLLSTTALVNCASFSPEGVHVQSQPLATQPQGPPSGKPRHNFQQFQVVVLPPGAHPPQPPQESHPPNPASPGYVWVQVPINPPSSASPPQQPLATEQPVTTDIPRPANPPNLPPLYVPAVQQPVPTTQQPIPSPEGENLNKGCLTPRGQFPTAICNKYLNCWDGVAVEQFCPEGLVFHVKGYCDYPENVNCGGRPIQSIPPPPIDVPGQSSSVPTLPQAPTTVAPPTPIVTLPNVDPNLRKKCLKPRGQFRSEACNKFVNCWDDVIIEQECPEGLLFSSKGYCDYAANVDCQNNTPNPHPPSRSADDERGSKPCPLDFGTFREKMNCSNYYTCIGGNIVAQYTCPSGFSFNDNLGVCDYSDRVDCSKDPVIFYPKSNFLQNIPQDLMAKIDQCKPGTVFGLNQQCTVACLCRDGLSEIVQCPAGLAYDTKTDKCQLPQVAQCQSS